MLSPIETLPNEILQRIMKFLPLEQLGRVCCVSRLWNQCASEIYYPLADLFTTNAYVSRAALSKLGVNLETMAVARDVYRKLKPLVCRNISIEKTDRMTFIYLDRPSMGTPYNGNGNDLKDIVQIGGLEKK